MPWLDILASAVLILFALSGFFKGFWRNFLSLFSSIVVIVLAILISKPIANLLESWFHVSSGLASSLQPSFANYFQATDWHTGWIYTLLVAFLGKTYLQSEPSAEELATAFSGSVSKILVSIICMVVVFLLIKLVLWLILKFTKKLSIKKSHRILDRIFGILLGIFKGFFVIFVASWILFAIGGVITPIAGWLDNMFASNGFAGWLYKISNHILQNWIFPFLLR